MTPTHPPAPRARPPRSRARPRPRLALLAAAGAAIWAAACALPPPGATCEAGASARRCAFGAGPVRLGPDRVAIPGKPHPYSPLLSTVTFRDGRGRDWTAPGATLTDGASIPPVFVPLLGDPRSDTFLAAAALHDAQCGAGNEALPQFKARSWEATHRMFYDALLAGGTEPRKAKVMFAAVYLAGPRWDDPARSLDGVPEARLIAEMEACLRFIEAEDPGLPALEAWMRDREAAMIAEADAG